MNVRVFSFSLMTLLGSCGAVESCVPTGPAAPTYIKGKDYAFMAEANGGPVYWDKCEGPITVQIDTTFPPTDAERADLHWAMEKMTQTAGFEFQVVGDHLGEDLMPGAKVSMGYRYFPEFQRLGYSGVGAGDNGKIGNGTLYVEKGMAQTYRRVMLLHEIGHLVGLGHVSDPTQVMYFEMNSMKLEYRQGDLEGLRILGAERPCV